MRQRWNLPPRLGRKHHHRVAGLGSGDRHAAVPAGHRPGLEGHRFGGARGRTDVPKIVDWYMDGKIISTT